MANKSSNKKTKKDVIDPSVQEENNTSINEVKEATASENTTDKTVDAVLETSENTTNPSSVQKLTSNDEQAEFRERQRRFHLGYI
jgi:hypothetical protein